MTNYKNKQDGLIKMIIVIVIAIAILSWYGVDIKEFFLSEQFQDNLNHVWNFLKLAWNYIVGVAQKIWNLIA